MECESTDQQNGGCTNISELSLIIIIIVINNVIIIIIVINNESAQTRISIINELYQLISSIINYTRI